MIPDKAFYVDPLNIKSNYFQLDKCESEHAIKVLRLNIGDKIFILDGVGCSYIAVITSIYLKIVKGEIIKSILNFGENNIKLELAPAIIKRDKFKILIEKGTELGVTKFQPLALERCIKNDINYSKIKKNIIASSKQCRRSRFPILSKAKSLEDFLKKSKNLIIAGVINSNNKIEDINFNNSKEISIIIGPEGDFTKNEIELLKKYGVLFYDMGERRLRSETAAIYSLSILNEKLE